MSPTNFDKYLDEQFADPDFALRYQKADEAWEVAIQLTQLRQKAGLSQAQLARRLKTSQAQISRLESANYEGHSLAMLRRIASALGARVVVSLQAQEHEGQANESQTPYSRTPRAVSKSARKQPSRLARTKDSNETTPAKSAVANKARKSANKSVPKSK